MASWEDGPEFAPVERPTGFATPRTAELGDPPPQQNLAAGRPADRPQFSAPSAPVAALERLDPSAEQRASRDPRQAFAVAAATMTGDGAWGAAHSGSADEAAPAWTPTQPLGVSTDPASAPGTQPGSSSDTTAIASLPAPTGPPVQFPAPTGSPVVPAAPSGHRPAQVAPPPGWQPQPGLPAQPGQGATPGRFPPGPGPTAPPQGPPSATGTRQYYPTPGTPGWFAPGQTQYPAPQPPGKVPVSLVTEALTPGVFFPLLIGGFFVVLSPVMFLLAGVMSRRMSVQRRTVGWGFGVAGAFIGLIGFGSGLAPDQDFSTWWSVVGGVSLACCWLVLLFALVVVNTALSKGERPTPRP